MSSRLVQDSRGRLVVEITATWDARSRVGDRFVVLGNDLPVNEVGFGWLGSRNGRRPDARERKRNRNIGARTRVSAWPVLTRVAHVGDNAETASASFS